MHKNCVNCKYWQTKSKPPDGMRCEHGTCHRFPPQFRPADGEPRFPDAAHSDWCGEWGPQGDLSRCDWDEISRLRAFGPACTQLLTSREVDRIFRYSSGQAVRLAKAGRLPHVTLPDGSIRFRQSDLEAIIGDSGDDGRQRAAEGASGEHIKSEE